MQIILIILAFLVISSIWIFNSLVTRKNDVTNAFSTIDVMLKRRHDLIPNLVECTRQYQGYERGLLEDVTELRSRAIGQEITEKDRLITENDLSGILANMMVVAENYPDLKASANFLDLQSALQETEEQIAASRRTYNSCVAAYNNLVKMFPSNLMAFLIQYKAKDYFGINGDERKL